MITETHMNYTSFESIKEKLESYFNGVPCMLHKNIIYNTYLDAKIAADSVAIECAKVHEIDFLPEFRIFKINVGFEKKFFPVFDGVGFYEKGGWNGYLWQRNFCTF